jgi:branched-chain amino acid transport system permease protein
MTEVIIGLSIGSIYGLVALGYNITYLAAGVVNFAHANLMVAGMFVAYWAYSSGDLPLPVVLLIAVLLAGLVGLVEERFAIRPLRGTSGSAELVTMVGVATVITGVIQVFFGSEAARVPFFASPELITIFGRTVQTVDLLIIGLAVGLMVILEVVTRRSRIGLIALAQTDDREAAQLRGINVNGLSTWGFVLAAVVAGLLGPLIVSKTFAASSLSLVLAVKGFVVLVLGGIGSHRGVLLAAFAIGLIEVFGARYIGPFYRDIVVFVLFALVLLLVPHGIGGSRKARAV